MDVPASDSIEARLNAQFARLKQAFLSEPYPALAVRRDRLRRAVNILVTNQKRIVEAIDADFGGQPETVSLLVDVLAPIRSLKHAHQHVERWMKPDMRKPDFPLAWLGSKAGLFYQPLGVVGSMSPWNAPVALSFSPLASMLAAGNRVFMRPSELAPRTTGLIAEMIAAAFDPSEIAVAVGDVELARAFARLPFDHLLFTGSASTARNVMRAAADHLVPLTLELGGKAPCIVARGCDLADAAAKFARGKTMNAGQVCMAPDFAYVHREDKEKFASEVKAALRRMYPQSIKNSDYTRIHLERQRRHLTALVADAAARGARVDVLDATPVERLGDDGCFPPVLVIDPPLDSSVMREEVFGPILPIVTYETLEEVVEMLTCLPRPLALYFIGGKRRDEEYLLRNTYSGGVSFGDVQYHILMQDYGQGGVGESGMGRYLGFEGFKTMSNCKAFARRPFIDVTWLIAPPYSQTLIKVLRKVVQASSIEAR